MTFKLSRPVEVTGEPRTWVPEDLARAHWFASHRNNAVMYFPRVGEILVEVGSSRCGRVESIDSGDPEGSNGDATIRLV